MPLGLDVGLDPGHLVLDELEDWTHLPQKGLSSHLLFGPGDWAKRSPIPATAEHLLWFVVN